jgi:hypothetical protein
LLRLLSLDAATPAVPAPERASPAATSAIPTNAIPANVLIPDSRRCDASAHPQFVPRDPLLHPPGRILSGIQPLQPARFCMGVTRPPNCCFLQVFVARGTLRPACPVALMKGVPLPELRHKKKALASESLLKHLNSSSSCRVSPSVSTFQTTSSAPSNPTR